MTKHLGFLAATLLLAVATAVPAGEEKDRKITVLIVDGQNNHAWQQTTPHMKQWLEATGRFAVEVATAPARPPGPQKPKNPKDAVAKAEYEDELAKFKPKERAYLEALGEFAPAFDKYDVVLSNYNGDTWSEKTREALDQYVETGKGGLVIVHAANNSFSNWKEFNQMIGMGWRSNGFGERLILDENGKEVRVEKGKGPSAGHGNKHAFKINIRDREHPIVQGMPAEWLHASDELYHGMRGPIENVHLIATAYSNKTTGGTGEHEPMIWTVTYGKGRVFHTPMGHDLDSMRCRGFIATLQRGTEWAATEKVTIPLPKDFPTATRTSSVMGK